MRQERSFSGPGVIMIDTIVDCRATRKNYRMCAIMRPLFIWRSFSFAHPNSLLYCFLMDDADDRKTDRIAVEIIVLREDDRPLHVKYQSLCAHAYLAALGVHSFPRPSSVAGFEAVVADVVAGEL
jgi:hypothetical protein